MAIRFAILGAGRIGQVHARAIGATEGAELAAVYDPVEAAASAVQAQYGCDIRSVEDCAAADDIDAALICTPTDLHADQIELFARAGKAVFCEKPIDLSVPRVQACLEVVKADLVLVADGGDRLDRGMRQVAGGVVLEEVVSDQLAEVIVLDRDGRCVGLGREEARCVHVVEGKVVDGLTGARVIPVGHGSVPSDP